MKTLEQIIIVVGLIPRLLMDDLMEEAEAVYRLAYDQFPRTVNRAGDWKESESLLASLTKLGEAIEAKKTMSKSEFLV